MTNREHQLMKKTLQLATLCEQIVHNYDSMPDARKSYNYDLTQLELYLDETIRTATELCNDQTRADAKLKSHEG